MNQPNIRFIGFNSKWDKICLNDIIRPSGIKNKDNLSLESYSISNENGFMPQNEKFENGGTMKDADKSMYYIVSPKSFAYNPARINVGSIGYYEQNKDVIVSSLYVVFKMDDKACDNHYFLQWFKSNKFKKLVELYQEGGVRLYFFYDKLCKCKIIKPSKSEQQQIASYFKSLDNLIQLTTKKITSLKQLKSASLISMFPQTGETKPRIRFKGFEGDWEIKRLYEISKKVIVKNSNLKYNITLTNSAEYGIINQLDFFDHEISNNNSISSYYIVENDDFVYNPRISVTAPVGPINRNKLGYTGIMSPLYYVFKVYDIDKDYLSFFFQTRIWHKYMFDNGNSGARFDRLSITDDMFGKMPIISPIDLAEQRQIASFFHSLDTQISLEAQRLEKLKQIKSACLDKMFV